MGCADPIPAARYSAAAVPIHAARKPLWIKVSEDGVGGLETGSLWRTKPGRVLLARHSRPSPNLGASQQLSAYWGLGAIVVGEQVESADHCFALAPLCSRPVRCDEHVRSDAEVIADLAC
jgi:hypothetical protein